MTGAPQTVEYCWLGQITNALFEVGEQYRRNTSPQIATNLTDETDMPAARAGF